MVFLLRRSHHSSMKGPKVLKDHDLRVRRHVATERGKGN